MLRPATPAEDRPAIWVDDRAVKVSVVSVEVAAEDRPPSWVAESLVAMALMSSLDRLERLLSWVEDRPASWAVPSLDSSAVPKLSSWAADRPASCLAAMPGNWVLVS